MKKFILPIFVALMATVSLTFTACSDDDEEISLSNIAGYTFEGTDSDEWDYSITFSSTDMTFNFDGATGTFKIDGNTITLSYDAVEGDPSYIEYLYGAGDKKLIYKVLSLNGGSLVEEEVILKRK